MDARRERPPGLSDWEAVVYVRGFSRGCVKYLKEHGSPSMEGPRPTDPVEFTTWRAELRAKTAEYQEGVQPVAHAAGMAALRAYWRRIGKVDPTKKAPAKRRVATKVNDDDAQRILAVAVRAKLVGTAPVLDEALSEVLGILGLTTTEQNGAIAA